MRHAAGRAFASTSGEGEECRADVEEEGLVGVNKGVA